jgi:hypothetical protein
VARAGRAAKIRLLFDELYSPRVARALYELKFHAYHVGGEGQPPRGSSDRDVLAHARTQHQTIVTFNLDMIMLCAEELESVIWVDPRGRGFTRIDMVHRAFSGIEEWEALLQAAVEPVCLRVLKTKTIALDLPTAYQMADTRLRKLRALPRRRTTHRSGGEPLTGV